MDALFRFILLLTISLTTPNDAFVFPTRNFCNYGNDILISHRQRSSSSTNNVSIHRTNDLSSSYCTYASIGLSSLYKLSLSSSLHEDARATNNNQTDSKPESMNLIKEQVLQPDSSSKITSIKATKEEHNIKELSSSSSTSSSSYDTTTIQSIVLLNFVAVIWGTQHSFIKIVVDDCDTSAFSFTRFALAALIATVGPSLFGNSIDTNGSNDQMNKTDLVVEAKNHEENQVAWRWGLEMGLWMFLGYAFQAIGLEYTTAQRSGFLLYLNIKLVPLFAFLIYQRKISIPTWISALTALTGTALLTFDGSTYDFNIGDVWSIAAAAASAMFILRLEFATEAVSNSSKLNSYSLLVVSAAALVWCLFDGTVNNGVYAIDSRSSSSIMDVSPSYAMIATSIGSTWNNVVDTITKHPLELAYLGGITTALANYIQTKAQKGISAERASIIYALDPVYGAFFAFAILGEQLNEWGMVGASLITIAAATNAFLDLGEKR